MKTTRSSSSMMLFFPFALLQLLAAAAPSLAQHSFDFFYFVQEWQGGCDGNQSCCYPTTGKLVPSFGIHGLWPSYNNGSYPSNCDRTVKFDPEEMTDLIPLLEMDWPTLACPSSDSTKLWEHEWEKHGTCCKEPGSESEFYPYKYFETALLLKRQVVNLFEILIMAGIPPDNERFYTLNSITDAITKAVGGFTPGITCNVDASGNNSQLYQIYLCVDPLRLKLIKCPVFPRSLSQKKCASQVQIPYFISNDEISMVVSN